MCIRDRIEATQIAGFSQDEAAKIFVRPSDTPSHIRVRVHPPADAAAAFLRRFAILGGQTRQKWPRSLSVATHSPAAVFSLYAFWWCLWLCQGLNNPDRHSCPQDQNYRVDSVMTCTNSVLYRAPPHNWNWYHIHRTQDYSWYPHHLLLDITSLWCESRKVKSLVCDHMPKSW